jgi:hypothetical protein
LKVFNELYHVNCRDFLPPIMSLFTCKGFILNSGNFSRFYLHSNRLNNSSISSLTMIIFINFNELYCTMYMYTKEGDFRETCRNALFWPEANLNFEFFEKMKNKKVFSPVILYRLGLCIKYRSVISGHFRSCSVMPGHVRSCPVMPGHARSCPVMSSHV